MDADNDKPAPPTHEEEVWLRFSYTPEAACHLCHKSQKVKESEVFDWKLCEECFGKGWRPPLLGAYFADNGDLVIKYSTCTSSIIITLLRKKPERIKKTRKMKKGARIRG